MAWVAPAIQAGAAIVGGRKSRKAQKKAQKSIPNIDPAQLIALQDRYNRVNLETPFGASRYVTGADGRTTVRTELSPEMQALLSRQFQLAGTDSQRYQMPGALSGIQDQLFQRVAGNLGGANQDRGISGAKQRVARPMPMPGTAKSGNMRQLPMPQQNIGQFFRGGG